MQKMYAWLNQSTEISGTIIERKLREYLKSVHGEGEIKHLFADNGKGSLLMTERARDRLMQIYISLLADGRNVPAVIFRNALKQMGLSKNELKKWHEKQSQRFDEYQTEIDDALRTFGIISTN